MKQIDTAPEYTHLISDSVLPVKDSLFFVTYAASEEVGTYQQMMGSYQQFMVNTYKGDILVCMNIKSFIK